MFCYNASGNVFREVHYMRAEVRPGLHVKCALLISDCDQKCNLSTNYTKSWTVSDFMEIPVALLELLHAERRTWRSEQAHLLQTFIANVPEIPIKNVGRGGSISTASAPVEGIMCVQCIVRQVTYYSFFTYKQMCPWAPPRSGKPGINLLLSGILKEQIKMEYIRKYVKY